VLTARGDGRAWRRAVTWKILEIQAEKGGKILEIQIEKGGKFAH